MFIGNKEACTAGYDSPAERKAMHVLLTIRPPVCLVLMNWPEEEFLSLQRPHRGFSSSKSWISQGYGKNG